MGEKAELDPSILGIQNAETEKPQEQQPVGAENASGNALNIGVDIKPATAKVLENKTATEARTTKLYDIEAVDLHDPSNSIRYVVKVDDKDKGKVYHRTYRFVVPEADRLAFLESRKKSKINVTTQGLVDQYASYRKGEPLKIEDQHWPNWYKDYLRSHREQHQSAEWFTDEQFKEQLKEWGYDLEGSREEDRTVAETVEQEIAGMLKENRYDLNPKNVSIHKSLQSDKGNLLSFRIDGRTFEYPLSEVKDRVETVLGLLEEDMLPMVEKYRAMGFGEIAKIKDSNERQLAMQTLVLFAGLPTKVLKMAQKFVGEGKSSLVLESYERLKSKQEQLRARGKRGIKSEDAIYIFETLGLRFRNQDNGLAGEAAQEALIKRLYRKPRVQEQPKDFLDEAMEFVKDLNLPKIGFKGLQKKIESLQILDKDKGMVYLAACLETGYTPRGVADDLRKREIYGPISSLEVFRTSARVALELVQQKAKDKKFVDYSDYPVFDKSRDVVFNDPEDKRSKTFVAKRRIQEGTGAQFVDVAIKKQPKPGEEQRKHRIFHLSYSGSVNSVIDAKNLQARAARIFSERHKQGQSLSFDPHIELVKSKTKNNPNFRLTLGSAQTEVDYKSLYDTLSFQNKVEAELLKSIFLDSQTSEKQSWNKMPDWKHRAVYKFHNIVSHSGLPSLTEQLIVQELKNKVTDVKAAAPILDKDRKVIATKRAKEPVKKETAPILPRGIVSPESLAALAAAAKIPEKPADKKSAKKTAAKKKK